MLGLILFFSLGLKFFEAGAAIFDTLWDEINQNFF